MSSSFPARKNTAFTFYTSLVSQGAPATFQNNPTLATGDVKLSKDGGASWVTLGTGTPHPASWFDVGQEYRDPQGHPVKYGAFADVLAGDDDRVAFAQALPVGTYVAMNGRCFRWDNVRKNKGSGAFEELRG